MKLVLMGTNDFVVPVFESLRQNHDIIAVFTRAPKPQGRKHILTPSPVYTWAMSHNLDVHTNINEYNFSPDMVIVISYGVILRDNVLQSAPCVNIHPSALPKYRGASPVQTALINGDSSLGVCLIQMTPDMDAGEILDQVEISIGENDTNSDILAGVCDVASGMLIKYLENPSGYVPVPQHGDVSYTRKYTGDDEILDWNKSPIKLHNQIRALGCGRTKINGIDVKILQTRVMDGKLEIIKIQPAGKNPMDWGSFINGLHGAEIIFGK